jgi:hypothetical protein
MTNKGANHSHRNDNSYSNDNRSDSSNRNDNDNNNRNDNRKFLSYGMNNKGQATKRRQERQPQAQRQRQVPSLRCGMTTKGANRGNPQ